MTEQDRVPPYEGRKEAADETRDEHASKLFRSGKPAPEPSQDTQQGVPPTDTSAESPKGVGESVTRSGEDVVKQEGRQHDVPGTTGESERPYGTTSPDVDSGVGAQAPQDEESPYLQKGDQGG